MKVTKNDFLVYGDKPELIYDDDIEGGGLRIHLPGADGDYFIEISDASEDYGEPRLQVRISGRISKGLLVRPQVSNSILVFEERL